MTDAALAYMNHGRWVADCPVGGCTDAREAVPDEPHMVCAAGHISRVKWPGNAAEITAALAERPQESLRDWIPAGHWLAEQHGFPADQTPDELRAETSMLAANADASRKQKIADALNLLSAAGVNVDPIARTIERM